MKIAIIGSRNAEKVDIDKYLSERPSMIISGGAKGIDRQAAEYARENGIELKEFLPDYEKYGRGAPIVRNRQIVEFSDQVLAFWDGKSPGTYSTIKYASKIGKPFKVITIKS